MASENYGYRMEAGKMRAARHARRRRKNQPALFGVEWRQNSAEAAMR